MRKFKLKYILLLLITLLTGIFVFIFPMLRQEQIVVGSPTVPVIEHYTKNNSGGGTATSLTLTKPDGVQVGDLLLIIAGNDDSGASSPFDEITGWTRFVNQGDSSTDAKLVYYWRIADDSEGDTINVTTGSNADEIWGWYIRISGVDQITPINALGTVYNTGGASSHAITEATTDVDDCLVIYALAFDGGDGYPFSVSGTGWTEEDEQQSGTGSYDACGCWGTKEQASQGGAGTATVSSNLSDGATAIQFAIAPAAPGLQQTHYRWRNDDGPEGNKTDFGSESIFNSATTNYVSAAKLDSTHFVMVYHEPTDPYNGQAVIGTLSGTSTIEFGPEYPFVSSMFAAGFSVAALDATHFVVSYDVGGGKAVIGELSSTSTISFGSTYTFEDTGVSDTSIAALNATSFAITYADADSPYHGKAVIGTLSGISTIEFGSEYTFNEEACVNGSASKLDSTHFVAAYRKSSSPYEGEAVIGILSGTSTIIFGSEYEFDGTAQSNYISTAGLDTTNFVVVYDDKGNSSQGTAVVGSFSSTSTVTFGGEYIFNSATSTYNSVSALDSIHFVVGYNDNNTTGTAVIGTFSGASTISYSSGYVFNDANTADTSVSALDSTHFVVGYKDVGNSDYGTAVIGVLTPAATWKQTEDTSHTSQAKNENIRVRFSVENGDISADNYNYRLQWAEKGGVWSDVPTTTGQAVIMTASIYFADGDNTTNQLTSEGIWTSGRMVEYPANQTDPITLDTNYFTEHEYSFQFTDDALNGTTYCFRVTNAGTALDNYSQIAEITTVVIPVILLQRAFIFENDDGVDVNSNSNAEAVNTTITGVKIGQRLIVRIQVDNTGDTLNYVDLRLQFDKNDSNWKEITAYSEIRVTDSLSGSNVDSLTSAKAGTCYPGTTWQNGTFHEDTNKTQSYSLPSDKCTEFALTIETSNATLNTTYRFQLYNNRDDKVLNNYVYYPSLTIVDETNDTERYSKNSSIEIPKNLSEKIAYLWGANSEVWALAYDSDNKKIYLAGRGGKFGVYDPVTDIALDKTRKIFSFWSTEYIEALVYDPVNQKIYLAGRGGKFGVYDPSTDIATNKKDKINLFWGNYTVNSLIFDSASSTIYLGGGDGNFAVYDPNGDSAVSKRDKINSIFGSNTVTGFAFDFINSTIYLGGSGGHFAVYNPSTGTAANKTGKISFWGTNDVRALTFDLANHKIYLGGVDGNFAVYNPPPTDAATNKKDKINSFWGGNSVNELSFDSTNNKIYLGGDNGNFAVYDPDPSKDSATNLKGEISGFWGDRNMHALTFDSDAIKIYLGGDINNFAVYDPGVKGIAADKTDKISPFWSSSHEVRGSTYDSASSTIYLGGTGGEFAVYDPSTGTSTDQTDEISSFWGSTRVNTLTYDSASSTVYLGGYKHAQWRSGKLAVYDPSTDTAVDKSNKCVNNAIFAITFDSTNNDVYVGAHGGKFSCYDPSSDTCTEKTDKISSFWGTNIIEALTYDSASSTIYLGGGRSRIVKDCKFAVYDPSTGTSTDQTDEISSFWGTYEIFALTYDSASSTIYLGGGNGNFAVYDPSTDTATDKTNELSTAWGGGAHDIYGLTFDSTNNKIYIFANEGRFAVYDPSTGTFTNETSKISSFWGTFGGRTLTFDSADNKIYLGGVGGKFAVYDPLAEIVESTINKKEKITPFWGVGHITATAFDSTNNTIYLGGEEGGRFTIYNPSTEEVIDRTSELRTAWGGNYDIRALTYDSANSTIYIGADQGRFAVYDPSTPDTAYDKTGEISGFWESNSIRALTFDSANSTIYLGGDNGQFAVYDPLSTAADKRDKISFWGTNQIKALTYDSANNKIYLGGQNPHFAVYDPSGTATDKTDKITSFGWTNEDIVALAYDSASSTIYLGGGGGNFAVYDPSSPDTVTNKKDKIESFWGGDVISDFAFDSTNNEIYFVGWGANLAVYNPSADRATNKTPKISSVWRNYYYRINNVLFNSADKKIYLVGEGGKFSSFNPGSGFYDDDLPYRLDKKGYSDVLADDSDLDPIPAISDTPAFLFVNRNPNNTDPINISWIGQSTVAASTKKIYLDVYRFGSTNKWVNLTSDTTCAADANCLLSASITENLSEYYKQSSSYYRSYFRVYQTLGTQTLKTDYFGPPVGVGAPSISDLRVQDPNSIDYCGVTGYPPVRVTWKFESLGDTQDAFEIEVATSPDFVADRVVHVTSSSSFGGFVFQEPPDKRLSWNTTYYWRVRAWDNSNTTSSCDYPGGWCYPPSPSGFPTAPQDADSFKTCHHAYPYVDFVSFPQNPSIGEVVTFNDDSWCYEGSEEHCWEKANTTYAWDFESDGIVDSTYKGNVVTTYSKIGKYTVKLKITDNSPSLSSPAICTKESDEPVRVGIPLPEWREVAPFSWSTSFFAWLMNSF